MMSTAIAPKKPDIKTELPGPKARAIVEADAQFVTPSYPRPSFKLVAERARGVWVEDVDGNVFLDCFEAGHACNWTRKIYRVLWQLSWTHAGIAFAHFVPGRTTPGI